MWGIDLRSSTVFTIFGMLVMLGCFINFANADHDENVIHVDDDWGRDFIVPAEFEKYDRPLEWFQTEDLYKISKDDDTGFLQITTTKKILLQPYKDFPGLFPMHMGLSKTFFDGYEKQQDAEISHTLNKLHIASWTNRTFDKAEEWITAEGCQDGFRDKTCAVVTAPIKNVNITNSEFIRYYNFIKHEIYHELHTWEGEILEGYSTSFYRLNGFGIEISFNAPADIYAEKIDMVRDSTNAIFQTYPERKSLTVMNSTYPEWVIGIATEWAMYDENSDIAMVIKYVDASNPNGTGNPSFKPTNIPNWFDIPTKWFAMGAITDLEYMHIIEYLTNHRIIY